MDVPANMSHCVHLTKIDVYESQFVLRLSHNDIHVAYLPYATLSLCKSLLHKLDSTFQNIF